MVLIWWILVLFTLNSEKTALGSLFWADWRGQFLVRARVVSAWLKPKVISSSLTCLTRPWAPQFLECSFVWYHSYVFWIKCFISSFPLMLSCVLESSPVGLLTMSPSTLCPSPHTPNPSLQITVSLAQGYERTSSPKPRFKSYAYTQAAYVSTSDPTRSPFPSQVCQHLLSSSNQKTPFKRT